MKTKVAVVLPYFGIGGAETMVSQLVSNLNPDVVDVEVFCVYGEPQNNRLEHEILEKGITIHYIGKKRGFSAKAIIQLSRKLTAFAPDVVHSHLYACVYAAPWVLCRHTKMIHTTHSLPEIENKRFLRKWLTVYMVKRSKLIPVAISDMLCERIADFYGIQASRIPVVYNPVEFDRFREHSTSRGNEFVFITVGRLSKEKNQQMLLDAFYELQKNEKAVKLVVVGNGPERQSLEESSGARNMLDKVDFVGYTENVEAYLAKADVFVLTSNYEGLPMVLLEAMAAGLPIISTDVGGVSDIVTDNGILVLPGSVKAMSDAMRQMLRQPELCREMGLRGKQRAAQYDVKMIAEQYTALYQRYRKDKVNGEHNRKW